MRKWMMLLILAAVFAEPAAAQPDARLRLAVTHHIATIRGAHIAYTATVSENPVAGSDGKPAAAIVTIAYTRDGVKNAARRPVLFAFNGGPGASSSPLHMRAMGPVVRASANPANRNDSALIENRESVLDAADIIFIDPVSTGFSRAYRGVDPKQWYDGARDAIAVADVIEHWLKANHREASPRFLVGESYGTSRAALILRHRPELRFDGVVLISGGTGGEDTPDMRLINAVPRMAAGAWYHRKVDRKGEDVGTFYREAARFARGDYAAALAKDKALTPRERADIAERLSAYIGLPPSLIEANALRIEENTYMFNLLKDRGLRTGRLDVRATSPLVAHADGAIDDPALNVVKPANQIDHTPTAAEIGLVPSPVVGRYIAEQLRFPTDDTYYGINFVANSQWTFEKIDPPSVMAAAMKSDVRLRLFLTTGYFDLGVGDATYVLAAGVPADRLTYLQLPGPHEVYAGADNRRAFNQALRVFVTRP